MRAPMRVPTIPRTSEAGGVTRRMNGGHGAKSAFAHPTDWALTIVLRRIPVVARMI
jgi:hypothetical protein